MVGDMSISCLFKLVTTAFLFGHQGSIPTSPPPCLAPPRCANCRGMKTSMYLRENFIIYQTCTYVESRHQVHQLAIEVLGECSAL